MLPLELGQSNPRAVPFELLSIHIYQQTRLHLLHLFLVMNELQEEHTATQTELRSERARRNQVRQELAGLRETTAQTEQLLQGKEATLANLSDELAQAKASLPTPVVKGRSSKKFLALDQQNKKLMEECGQLVQANRQAAASIRHIQE